MNIVLAIVAFLGAVGVQALSLDYLASGLVEHQASFKKTKIGGLSAIWFDSEKSEYIAFSDDRGRVSEPRFYRFQITQNKTELKIVPTEVVFIHDSQKSSQKTVLDLEAIAPLPWGNFLVSSEGDNNQKPRVLPQLLDIKKDGTLIRSYELPEKFLPELSGKQKRGIRNNLGFEGLTAVPSGQSFYAWLEGPLAQDSGEAVDGPVRVLRYDMPEAWVLKPSKEYLYQPEAKMSLAESMVMSSRVSEALALSDTEFLVLERAVSLGAKGLTFVCQLFKASLTEAEDVSQYQSLLKLPPGQDLSKLKKIKKELVFDFASIQEKLGGSIENFEAMGFGPLVDGKKTIVLVSDDNFKKIQKTQFVLLKLIE